MNNTTASDLASGRRSWTGPNARAPLWGLFHGRHAAENKFARGVDRILSML